MSTECSRGVVLRVFPLTETSLIIRWLTPDLGRLATVAKGARRPTSSFRGKLDLYYLCDFSFVRSRRSDLHTLREVSLMETHSFLRTDFARLQQAAYCASLLEQTTETETPLPEMYQLFMEFLGALAITSAIPAAVLAFEIKLLAEQGLLPDFEECRLSEAATAWIQGCQENPLNAGAALNPAQSLEISRFLHGFLIYHLGRIPNGRQAALNLNGAF